MKRFAEFVPKKFYLYLLMCLLIVVIAGCAEIEEESATTALSDDFSSYSTFPSSPWFVVDGDSSSWSIESSSDTYAARFYTTASAYSCLLNEDFNETGNVSVIAEIKIASVETGGATYGLYLRATSDLSSFYSAIFDTANELIYIFRIKNGLASLLGSVSWSVSTYMTSYQTYKFKLYENSDGTATVSIYVDGTSMLSVTDSSPLTSGYYTGFFFSDVLDASIASYSISQP